MYCSLSVRISALLENCQKGTKRYKAAGYCYKKLIRLTSFRKSNRALYITMFPYHVEGDTCAPSYTPYFIQAAELIGEACASYSPQ